ncbi:hypothetical protein LCGC14_2815510, partial [marine sediment metagenome]
MRPPMEADALAGLAEAANADAQPEHRRADAQVHPASALVPPSHVLATPSGLPSPAGQLGAERQQHSLKCRVEMEFDGHLKFDYWDWSKSDYWELFFDVRAADRRFGEYGPGTFNVVVAPAAAKDRPAFGNPCTGPAVPKITLTRKRTVDGTAATVELTWAELTRLTGARPTELAFGAALNSFSDRDRYSKQKPGRAYL